MTIVTRAQAEAEADAEAAETLMSLRNAPTGRGNVVTVRTELSSALVSFGSWAPAALEELRTSPFCVWQFGAECPIRVPPPIVVPGERRIRIWTLPSDAAYALFSEADSCRPFGSQTGRENCPNCLLVLLLLCPGEMGFERLIGLPRRPLRNDLTGVGFPCKMRRQP